MKKLKLVKVNVIDFNGFKLLLEPNSGNWIFFDNQACDIALSFNGELTFEDINKKYPYVSINEIKRIVNSLKESGLIQNETCDKCCKKSKQRFPRHVVANITEKCNLKCLYCYVNAKSDNSEFMSEETAIRIIDELLSLHKDSEEKIAFLFHGGEPLLNFKLIEAVVNYIEPFKEKIVLQIQTNATLIQEKHAKFFKEHNIQVGISFDGTKRSHDYTRPFANGTGSHDSVVRGIRLLKNEGINPGALIVLNKYNYLDTDEIIDFCIDFGIYSFSFLPLLASGRGQEHEELFISGEQMFEAFKNITHRIIDYNTKHKFSGEKINERTLSSLADSIFAHNQSFMCMRMPCGAGLDTLGISVNGDVYACDNLIGESDYYLGNIMTTHLKDLVSDSQVIKQLSSMSVNTTEPCAQCIWRAFCGGFCTAQKHFSDNVNFDNYTLCEFKKKFIPYLLNLFIENTYLPGLLNPNLETEQSKTLYFNINFSCNNRCIFCAADLSECQNTPEINMETFSALLDVNSVKKGDKVILNGGEPTVSPYLCDMLCEIQSRGADCVLFTNGRKFSNIDFCKNVLNSGISLIKIPLFGNTSNTHDTLTGVNGSFLETTQGIINILKLRNQMGINVKLELKLLFFKPTLDSNIKTLDWIVNTFIEADIISLNSLIVSKTVLKHKENLIPTTEELSQSINKTLDYVRMNNLEALVKLADIPFCLLDERNYCFLPDYETEDMESKQSLYFAPDCLIGEKHVLNEDLLPEICHKCLLKNQCKFISRIDDTTQATIEMLNS